MPSREWRLRVEDMLEAIGRIEEFVQGLDLDAFVKDNAIEAKAENDSGVRAVPPNFKRSTPQLPSALSRQS